MTPKSRTLDENCHELPCFTFLLRTWNITFKINQHLLFPVRWLLDSVKSNLCQQHPEWPSGLVPARHFGAPGSLPGRSVGLSEINFSDLYCGWLGRIINVEYNTTQHNTTGARWCRGMFGALQLEGCGFESTSKPPRRDPGQVLDSQLLMRFGVKLRFSVRAVGLVGSASEWEIW